MFSSRTSIGRRRLPPELILTLVILVALLGWYLNGHRFTLSMQQSAQQDPAEPQGLLDSDIAIIIHDGHTASSWDNLVCDQAWLNAVEQEIGHFQLIMSASFQKADLEHVAWTIIPRDTAERLSSEQISWVKDWVSRGGILYLEQPEGPWGDLIGARLSTAQQRSSRRITSFDAALSRGLARERLLTMPLHTTVVPYRPRNMVAGRDYFVLMEIDGTPGIVDVPVGKGHVILLLFDFGRANIAMQQGLPNGNFSIHRPEAARLPADLSLSSVTAINTDARESMGPWMDLLERNILYLAGRYRPIAGLWSFPNRHRGALMMTHSESRVGDMLRYMPEWEYAHDASSTSFITANSIKPSVISAIRRRHSDVQLQWIPESTPVAPMKSWGFRNIRLIQSPMTLHEQRQELDKRLVPYAPSLATRTLDGIWPTQYFQAFRELEAANVAMDSSLGPAPAFLVPNNQDHGYIFGTGLPFRPIAANGRRFSFYELPYLLTDGNSGYNGKRVKQLIIESSDAYHTVINIDWRADTMSRHPSFDALEGWRNSIDYAKSQGLWITQFDDYLEFLNYREQSAIRTRFSKERLLIQVYIPEIRRDANGNYVPLTPSVRFPARYRSRPVQFVWLDGEPVNVYNLFLSGDRALHVLPLTPGEHRIEVYYGTLADPTPN